MALERNACCHALHDGNYGQARRFGDKFYTIKGHTRDCKSKEAIKLREQALGDQRGNAG